MEYLDESLYILLIGLLIGLIPAILFMLTQYNTLKAIHPENRSMEPGQVFLQLIPLFSLVWQFIVVSRISESLRREFLSWQNDDSILGYTHAESVGYHGEAPTYSIGMAYCILMCCSIIPFLGTLAVLAGLVCWIIYWVKLAEFKRKVTEANRGRL